MLSIMLSDKKIIEKTPIILSIETATNACSVALQTKSQYFHAHKIAPRLHSQLVLQMVDSLLKQANIEMSAIEAIAFGCGPGSFMGVRLAIGIAQGLAFGISAPVIPVSTLQTLAQTAFEKTPSEQIIAGWDARMGDIYWGLYQNTSGIMAPVQNDRLSRPSEIDIKIDGTYTAAGNAWSVYQDTLPKKLMQQCKGFELDIYPEARAMLTIATSKFLAGNTVSPENAHPAYCRHNVAHTNASSR